MKLFRFLLAACALLLSACGGGNDAVPVPSVPRLMAEIAYPTLTSFDLGTVDPATGKYYLTDVGNKAVDVFDTSGATTQIDQLAVGSFAGNNAVGSDRSHNGPNGVIKIPGTNLLYVSDVNALKAVDTTTKAVVKTIALSTSGRRVDEGCYDPDDGILMFASPEESPPFVSFVSTRTQALIAKFTFPADTAGLEQCVYDPSSKSFLINNDGTTAHPDGEIDVITAASVLANLPVVSKIYPLDGCSPAGLALGPNNDMVVGCNPSPPLTRQITIVMDRTNGAVLAKVPFGGADAVAYDPVTNRYFIAAFSNQTSGVPASPATASPALGIIDAATRTLLMQLPTGRGSHVLSVDSANHKVYVPHLAGAAGSAFPVAGVSVFSTN